LIYYAGVGSRETPPDILKLMRLISHKFSLYGWTLRSGGAIGADRAFESNAVLKQIFYEEDATTEVIEIAASFHPAWHNCKPRARRLHGRNVFQVLGRDLNSPSSFVVCWTPDGCTTDKARSITTGGTGTAISVADHYKIPVFNLARPDHKSTFIKEIS